MVNLVARIFWLFDQRGKTLDTRLIHGRNMISDDHHCHKLTRVFEMM